mmetsp:Transcript_7763/g.17711  ORF Transcript_7763/g.17711 Transcript_7763/m.17711 type:complete len:94 (-) Transcript_7763:50-331(-)
MDGSQRQEARTVVVAEEAAVVDHLVGVADSHLVGVAVAVDSVDARLDQLDAVDAVVDSVDAHLDPVVVVVAVADRMIFRVGEGCGGKWSSFFS